MNSYGNGSAQHHHSHYGRGEKVRTPSPADTTATSVHWSSKNKQLQFQQEQKQQMQQDPRIKTRRISQYSDEDQECVPIAAGVKTVALLAIFLGIGVMGACSWVLHRSIQDWRNPTLVTANNLLSQVNTFFGGTTGLYDLDVIYRILTSCSATGFVGGIAQFFLSLWLLLATEGGGRTVAKIWVIAHVAIMTVIGGAFLCIMTNELQINTSIIVFLAVTGTNFLLLLPFAWVVFMYGAYRDPNTYV